MDTREREILDRNQGLLLSNIIQSEDFYFQMKKENVLPETMIRDIQNSGNLEDKNRKLLQTLKLRGGDSYRRFRHVLYLTGHRFLADQLYGEDYDFKVLKAEEIFSKFPSIFKHVSDDVKSKFLRYMETKLKETALRSAWLKSGTDRNDFLDVKKANFETEKEYRTKVEATKKRMSLLQDEIVHLREKLKRGESDKMAVQREIIEMRMNFKEDLAKQARFNAANNNSVIQLRSNFDQFNDRVKTLNVSLRGFFTGKDESENDENPDDMKLSFLERNIKRLMQIAKSSLDKTSNSMNEKEVVLSMLNTSAHHQQETLSEVVRHYVDKQEKGKASISRELEGLLDIVRGTKFTARFSTRPRTDMKLIKTQVATLKEEIDHMKKKIDWKDGQITDLIHENTTLREQLMAVPPANNGPPALPRLQPPSTVTRDSPDSTQEIENVYQQFDRYMHESYTPQPANPRMRRRGSLAEVNLEQEVSPPISRRDSKIENIDVVDILGSSSRPVGSDVTFKRRSSLPNILEHSSLVGKPKSTLPLTNLNSQSLVVSNGPCLQAISEHETQDATKNDVIKMAGPNPERNDENRKKLRKRKEVEIPDFKRQGRRPSLAELITIYEDTQRDQEVEAELADREQENVH